MTVPIVIVGLTLIPPQRVAPSSDPQPKWAKLKGLDLVGVSLLTSAYDILHRALQIYAQDWGTCVFIVALILFIFSLTSGSTEGWASAMVLAPLIISIFLLISFFVWERSHPSEKAAVWVWFLRHFMTHFETYHPHIDLPILGFIRTFLLFLLLRLCHFSGGHPFSPFSRLSGKMYTIGLSFPPQYTCKPIISTITESFHRVTTPIGFLLAYWLSHWASPAHCLGLSTPNGSFWLGSRWWSSERCYWLLRTRQTSTGHLYSQLLLWDLQVLCSRIPIPSQYFQYFSSTSENFTYQLGI